MKKLKSIYMRLKLRQRMLLYAGGLLALMAAIFAWFVFGANQSIVLNRVHAVNEENSRRIEEYFDHLDTQIQGLARYLQTSISVEEALTAGSGEKWSIDALVGDVANRNFVSYLDVYLPDGTLFASTRPAGETSELPEEVVEQLRQEEDGLYWRSIAPDLAERSVCAYAPLVYDGEIRGVVAFTILSPLLTEIYNYVGFNITSQVCILRGGERRIIPEDLSSSDYVVTQTAYRKLTQEGIQDFELTRSGETLYLYSTYLEKYDLYLVHISMGQDVESMMAMVNVAAMILCAIFLAIFLLFSNMMVNTVTRPIVELANTMSRVSEGHLELKVPTGRQDELGILAESFNTMIQRINELIAENEENQRTQRRLELDALQMQITPHFLYNTLESFSSLSLMGDGETAYSMASALSGFYRHVLSDGRSVIRVSEELEMVRNYLIIQSIRYADKFTYDFDVPEEILRASIVKLTIQPLVENAIYHGIREVTHKGSIEIVGQVEPDCYLLQVKDNGRGMEHEGIPPASRPTGGVGLSNVDQRLRLYFGDAYGLHIRSALGVGTCVEVRLPKLEYGGDQIDFGFNRR